MIVTDAAASVTAGRTRWARRSPQPAAAVGREHARGGQPAEPEREDHHQHDAEPERPACSRRRARRPRSAGRAASRPRRGGDAEREAADGGEQQRASPVRSSVALKRSSTSASTGRFIQSERPRSPRSDVAHPVRRTARGAARSARARAAGASRSSWVGLRAQHDLGRVARREMQHDEDDDRHAEQHRHQQQEPARRGSASPSAGRVTSARSSPRGGRSSGGA